MPISQDFNYTKASSLDEALQLRHGHGKKAAFIAGGTDLANMLKHRHQGAARAGADQTHRQHAAYRCVGHLL